MNSCDFVGKFKSDPILHTYTRPDGNQASVANFVLEISRVFRKRNGDKREQTYCLDFEAWDIGAKLIVDSFQKDDWITVHSSAKVDRHEDRITGKTVNKVRFRVNEFEIPKFSNAAERLTVQHGSV